MTSTFAPGRLEAAPCNMGFHPPAASSSTISSMYRFDLGRRSTNSTPMRLVAAEPRQPAAHAKRQLIDRKGQLKDCRQIEIWLRLVHQHELAPSQTQIFYSRRARLLDAEKMDLCDALAFKPWVLP